MKEKNEKNLRNADSAVIPPELAAKAKAGDQAAFTELYELSYRKLYRTIHSMVRDEDLAWDILQDSYIRAWRGLDKLESGEAFLPWLRRIAVNVTATQMAQKRTLTFTDLAGDEDEGAVPDIPDLNTDNQPELALDRQETSRLVREILAELPEAQQMILGMHYYEDMPIKEIAETLRIAPGTVKAQLWKGRKKVETAVRALEKRGVKLYGLSPLPFLLALLRRLEPGQAAEQKALAVVLAEAPAAGGTAVTVTAMTAGQAFLHGLGTKLLAGALAVALLIGGGKLAYDAVKKGKAPRIGDVQSTAEETVKLTEPELSEETTLPQKLCAPDNAPENACGPDLTWSFDEDTETLTIEGSGAMFDFEEGEAPWQEYREIIKALRLPEKLTSIGACAFWNCSDLDEATIPPNVTTIGNSAFSKCYIMHSVTIPASVTDIGDEAFSFCNGLLRIIVAPDNPVYSSDASGVLFNKDQTVLIHFPNLYDGNYSIPEGVTTIEDRALFGCYLRSLTIPASVTAIGSNALDSCYNLARIDVAPDNPAYSSDENGILFDKEQAVLIHFPTDYQGSYSISGRVTTIEDYAFFNCDELSSVTIPASVTAIGDNAFADCFNLSGIYVEEGNPAYSNDENGVLFNKEHTTLIQFPNGYQGSYVIPQSMTRIDEYAFSNCSGLSSVTIPEGISSIGDYAFNNCTGLTSVSIPSSVTVIGEGVFYHCASLSSVEIPESVTSIGDYAFYQCSEIPFESLSSMGDIEFSNCGGLTSVTIPESVTSIGNYAFSNCYALDSVTIPVSVTSIGKGTFHFCLSLSSVEIPSSVTSIGDSAFEYCTGLTSVTIPEGVITIGEAAFNSCSGLSSVEIPNGVTTIGGGAFHGCGSLSAVTIPASVTDIGDQAFASCAKLSGIFVAPDNLAYSSDEHGVLFNKEQTVLIQFPVGYQGSYTLPESMTAVGDHTFSYCTGLSAVTIPEGITSIGDYAFSDCRSLNSVTIPDSVTAIGENAFSFCSSLNSVIIPAGVTSIGSDAFAYCDSLSGIYAAPNNPAYSSNEDGIFFNKDQTVLMWFPCGYQGSYTIPESVTVIGDNAFSNCDGLSSVTIPGGVTSIGDYAFCYCTGLRSVAIHEGVTSIGEYAFYGCQSLDSVMIPADVTSIGEGAFFSCSGLHSVTIPATVTTIGNDAFAECENLAGVYVEPDNPSYCSDESGVLFNKEQTVLIHFPTCYQGSYVIPSSVTSIGDTFAFCSGLSSVTIPGSVISIEDENFRDCGSLSSVIISEGVSSIGNGAFTNCSKLSSVTIPASVNSIGNYAFSECSGLRSVTILEGVSSIGKGAFNDCPNLSSVTIPASVKLEDDYIFIGCSKLEIYGSPGSAAEQFANENHIPFKAAP